MISIDSVAINRVKTYSMIFALVDTHHGHVLFRRTARQGIECYYQNTGGCSIETTLDAAITKVETSIISLAGRWCDLSRPKVCEQKPVCDPVQAIATCFQQPGQYTDQICKYVQVLCLNSVSVIARSFT